MAERIDMVQKMRETRVQTRAAARSMADLAKAMMLAGIGAVALARDESKALVDRLVERGTVAEQEARRAMDQMAERSREQGGQTQARLEKQVENVLGRMNIPTRDDVTNLNVQISTLSTKIDRLLGTTPPAPGGPEDQTPVI